MRITKFTDDNYEIGDITQEEYQLLMNAISTARGALEMNVDTFSKKIRSKLFDMLERFSINE